MVKIEVGQTVWVVKKSYNGKPNEPTEAKVSKVGRKYFELEGVIRSKFDINTMVEANEFNYKSHCYLTLQEILDEREFNVLTQKMRSFFTGYGKINISLETLRKIDELLTK